MPDYSHSDREDHLDSEGEMDGMMDDVPPLDEESEVSADTSSEEEEDEEDASSA